MLKWLLLLLLATALPACRDESGGDPLPDGTITAMDAGRALPDAADLGDAEPPDAAPPVLDAQLDAGPDAQSDAQLDASAADLGGLDSGRPPICLEEAVPPEQPPIDLEARCRAPGDPLRIRDIRDARCPDWQRLPEQAPGPELVLEEAIVTGVFSDGFFAVQDPEGGAYSGLWVYNRSGLPVDELRPGTRLSLRGEVIEFFTVTELVIGEAGDFQVLEQGAPPPPILVVDPGQIGDGGDLNEALESVLLEIPTVRVLDTAPDCPQDFGMFIVTGGLRIDDEAPYDYTAALGDVLVRTLGVLHFGFGHWKLLPRGDEDLDAVLCGGVPDKCVAMECPVEPEAPETGALIVTEIQNNPAGDDNVREYVELYNPGPSPIDLSGWWVRDCGNNRADLSGTVAPRGFHVIARSRDRALNGGVRADGDMGELFLPNSYGSVLVFDPEERLVDQVRYEPVEPWPARHPGEALQLVEPAADNRDGAAWGIGEARYGEGGRGSPGGPYRP